MDFASCVGRIHRSDFWSDFFFAENTGYVFVREVKKKFFGFCELCRVDPPEWLLEWLFFSGNTGYDFVLTWVTFGVTFFFLLKKHAYGFLVFLSFFLQICLTTLGQIINSFPPLCFQQKFKSSSQPSYFFQKKKIILSSKKKEWNHRVDGRKLPEKKKRHSKKSPRWGQKT